MVIGATTLPIGSADQWFHVDSQKPTNLSLFARSDAARGESSTAALMAGKSPLREPTERFEATYERRRFHVYKYKLTYERLEVGCGL